MSTAEKRAQLAAAGEPWPDCECHDEPMAWQKHKNGGYFGCRIRKLEDSRRRRTERINAAVCVDCSTPVVDGVLCGECGERHRQACDEWNHSAYGQLNRYLKNTAYRKRSGATGTGAEAFRRWLTN